MSFVLTEEQESIRKTARAVARERLPVANLRALRDRNDATGYSEDAWRAMADLGLAGAAIPEAYGGSALGYAELGLVLEECGRTLAATPMVSTVLLAANALLLAGSEAQKAEHLPAIARGERVVAFAVDEGTRHAPHRVTTRLDETPEGYTLTGEKTFVLDGHVASHVVVVARSFGAATDDDGLTMVLVPAVAANVHIARTHLVDTRNAARITFSGVTLPKSAVLGTVGGARSALSTTLDRARIGLAAEMLGGLQETFEQTLAYLKTRKQFGVPIGSFQALKHRAAALFCEVELTKSIVMDALRAIDENRPDVAQLASAAKARATDTYLTVTAEAVQMHGGIGVTDDLDIGLFLKRARVCEMTLGDSAYHRDRYARLLGY